MILVTKTSDQTRQRGVCVCVCVCVPPTTVRSLVPIYFSERTPGTVVGQCCATAADMTMMILVLLMVGVDEVLRRSSLAIGT